MDAAPSDGKLEACSSHEQQNDDKNVGIKKARKRTVNEPPDGGYGWVIVAAAFVGHGFILYNARAVGVLLLDLKQEFDVPYANLNVIFSLLIGCIYVAAPVVSMFGNRFGSRATAMVGGFLQFAGLSIAAFSPSVACIHVFLGFVTGLGLSFSAMPLSVEIGRYFTKRRSLALGVQQIGPSIFSMIASPMTQYLIDMYGWRGALLITGALNLNTAACGATLRPIVLESDIQALDEKGKKKMLDLKIFRSKKFNLYNIALALVSPAMFFMSYYLVAYARTVQGFTEYQAAFLLALSSAFSLAARPATGLIATYTKVTSFVLVTVLSGTMGLCYLLYPFVSSYWLSAVILCVFMFGVGGVSPMIIACLTEIVGPSRLMSAFGLQGFTGAATAMLAQPFAGWLSDVYGTLRVVMWIGFAMMTAGTALLVIYCVVFDTTKAKTSSDEENVE